LVHAEEADFSVRGLTFSPIKGPEGNIEYLGYLTVGRGQNQEWDLKTLVQQSHGNFGEAAQ
jgi:23S rRNA (cytidine1920-2'-O)/16S rRNA (cytidine1409-2'-O)-methyltransferase